ncbi:MAG: PLP-dependent aspartate aminotransferase family protein, partial [Candidatus Thermoplasmatota archaeon]
MKTATRVVHGGQKPDPTTGAITTPIYQTATYVLEHLGRDKGFDYSRCSTPTRRVLERLLAEIEGGKDSTAFGSGMAAIDALMHSLEPGAHVLASDDLYGGTTRLFTQIFKKHGLEFDFVEMGDDANVRRHLKENTRMVFVETPTNPMLKLVDIAMVSELVDGSEIKFVVDNTFMTPYFQRPLALGADTVVHSLTKFLSGHNDVVGGAVISNDEEVIEDMRFMVKAVGATMGPFDSWLTIRGIKTLALRMERINENAMRIARFLEGHPKVERVIYPGLDSHPQHDLAKRQMTGFGGIITFELKGGYDLAAKCVERLEIWSFAESLGGVES